MEERDPEGEGGPRSRALVGLVVIVLLVVLGFWLARQLHTSAALQDCLAAGRRNCAPIELPAR